MPFALPLGVEAPVASRLRVTSPAGGFDLSTVSAVAWEVTPPGAVVRLWPATIASKTATLIETTHVHAKTDVERPGVYAVRLRMTVPGFPAPVYSQRVQFTGDPNL